ncbi:MAG: MerR family transcriptional regulator [Desulfobacterales bacterium]
MTEPVRFTIGYVSMQTGLSAHVIRAWERRYQAVTPLRSKSNRRLYTQLDMNRLRLLKRAIQNGHRISTLAGLETADLVSLADFPPLLHESRRRSRSAAGVDTQETIRACLQAVAVLDGGGLQRLLQRATTSLGRTLLMEGIIQPFMDEVGRRWSSGSLRIVHGHLASVVVHTQLASMLLHPGGDAAEKPCLMIATPAGQHCFLGALAVALIAQDQGWRVIFLGANLPAEEIAAASFMLGPQMVALSITCRSDELVMVDELIRLVKLMNHRCPMVIGGRAGHKLRGHSELCRGAICATTEELIDVLQSPTAVSVATSPIGNASVHNAD